MNSHDARHLIVTVEEHRKSPRTDAEIVNYLAWNLHVMETGLHPFVDHHGNPLDKYRASLAGTPLAGGWRASFYGWTGDIKEKVKQHRFSRAWNCLFLCERCLGCRHLQSGSAYDFNQHAAWKSMLVDHDLYMRSTPPEALSPWCKIRSWRLDRVHDDLLHTVWLGWGKDLIGQLLHDFALASHGRLDLGLAALSRECKAWYRAKGICFNVRKWTPTTISVKKLADYPSLETKQKAAPTKMIFMWAAQRAVTIVRDGTDTSTYARLRGDMCWCLLRAIDLFDRGSELLTPEAAQEAYEVGTRGLQLYGHLAAVAVEMGVAAYKVSCNAHRRRARLCMYVCVCIGILAQPVR
jgi:hypothetical protein